MLLCVLLGGCAREEVLSLSRFELFVPGTPGSVQVQIPQHLDDLLPARNVEYRLEAQVQVPEGLRGRSLTLAIPHLFARCQLFVNGREMVELDPEFGRTYRSQGTLRFRIPAAFSAQPDLDLSLRVQHTWTQSGWLDTPLRISESVAGDAFSYFTDSFNRQGAWVGLVTVFVVCFISLLVFLLDRRQVAFAWFALEATFGSTMPLFQMGAGRQLLGVYDAVMMAAGVTIGLWASVHFTHSQFGLGRPHRGLDILLVLTLTLIASGPGPFTLTNRAGPTVIGFISVNVIYQIYATTRLWMRGIRRLHALVLAVSWGALGIAACADQLAWVGLGEAFGGVRAAPIGLAAIALLQAGVLSHDYITTLRHADGLNRELAERVQMLESRDLENSALNEVLQRQIAARSEQLAHAIVRLGAARTMTAGELAIDSVLENRYRILGILGRGGMGTVYEVMRLIDQKSFALKVLSGRGGSVEMARFAREAQLVAQLQHPNVVSIVDVDVATNGLLFIVLELVRGKTLREHMARAANDREFALRVLAQVAEGLSSIHERRIVHRDLKPDNILILEDSGSGTLQVKITDFGVSAVAQAAREDHPTRDGQSTMADLTVRLTRDHAALELSGPPAHDSEQGLTEAGMLIGTPRYMAPEAIDGPSPAADVFAFGVMAFELLSGSTPFVEPLVMLRLAGRPMSEVPKLCGMASDLPSEVTDLIERCLLEDPTLRPTAPELVKVLRSHGG